MKAKSRATIPATYRFTCDMVPTSDPDLPCGASAEQASPATPPGWALVYGAYACPDHVPPVPPVDRARRELAGGGPVTDDHREINPATGQQKGYVVLTAEERAKGFVRPVRRTYKHLTCGTTTTMGLAIAETYARDPGFYGGTFCCHCRAHFPLDQFCWEGTDEIVGS